MLALGLILLLIGLLLALVPHGLRSPAHTIGWILVIVGVVLICADVLAIGGAEVDD